MEKPQSFFGVALTGGFLLGHVMQKFDAVKIEQVQKNNEFWVHMKFNTPITSNEVINRLIQYNEHVEKKVAMVSRDANHIITWQSNKLNHWLIKEINEQHEKALQGYESTYNEWSLRRVRIIF